MIDRLELKVPPETRYQSNFNDLKTRYADTWLSQVHRDTFPYRFAADLRPFGYRFRFHSRERFHHFDKFTFYDVGDLSATQILAQLNRIVQCDPAELEIVRTDLAVDVFDKSVGWFWRNSRVSYKQTSIEFHQASLKPEREVCPGGIETLYFGKRPNFFRIYDKEAEIKYEIRRQTAIQQEIERLASFEQSPHPFWTRVERQFSGPQLPKRQRTLGDFLERVGCLDPFQNLVFRDADDALPDKWTMTPKRYVKLLGMKCLLENEGLNESVRYLNSSGRHGQKSISELHRVLSANHKFEPPHLFDAFLQSIQAQLYPRCPATTLETFGETEFNDLLPLCEGFSNASHHPPCLVN